MIGETWGGSNYVSSVKDQGTCGSCWAFGPTAALESKYMITNTTPGSSVDLSEQIVLSCSGGGNCGGGYASTASDFLRDTGTAVETCYPYTATNGNCSSACSGWQSETYYFTSLRYVNSGKNATSTDIKTAVYSDGPVVVWMKVYTDFYSYSSGVYSWSSGSYEGNHFVLVVGWDDSQNAFIVKNSWGTSWGESGYFRIAYSQLTGSVQFGYWTYAYGSAYGPPIQLPLTTTTVISAITSTSASSGGNVTSDGGAAVTARGVCWSTSANPTISNSKTTDGTGTGSFTSSIIGLSPGTTYHVRAYAINSAGTGYGTDKSFTTLSPPCPNCSDGIVTIENVTFYSGTT